MNRTIVHYRSNMFEVIRFISAYLGIGCIWIIWFEWFCNNNKIGGAFSNNERYIQMLLWPLNLGVFLYTWVLEVINNFNNGGPRSY